MPPCSPKPTNTTLQEGIPCTNPAIPPPSSLKPGENSREKWKQTLRANAHATRKKRRLAQQEARFGDGPVPSGAQSKYVCAAEPVYTPLDSRHAGITSTGFTALDCGSIDGKTHQTYRLKDMVGERSTFNLSLQEWDGKTPMAVVDLDGRIFGFLAGIPDADYWEEQHQAAAQLLEDARRRCRLPKHSAHHRRGAFTTLWCGFSHGGGSTEPGNCTDTKTNKGILDGLMSAEPFSRIAGFGSCLHKHYVEKLCEVQKANPSLKRPFLNSVFPSTMFNLGPRTVCYPHRDFANLSFGFCAITALGSFNPKKGGHLVLWECGLVIEFPQDQPSSFHHPSSPTLIPPSPNPRRATPACNMRQVAYSDG
ncbi:hypothetical protein CPB84DRAFT_1751652 [Gymnopilus junonius]|uniref:Uncharacterized protein n=1 Tax=Gymnopilus junonius TaxID=109634 RepID=A0A9P5NEX3_GYMJU|nr:hypothetical protein CPB84DRAFT_1751652 [Gymnopilus junonius]